MSANIVTWLSRASLNDCLEEANHHYPRETGGVFMGYWSIPRVAVVTTMIGPGPAANRGRHYFEPDQNWQTAKIADHYEQSGRRETYLGDWHSHPNASTGHLSRIDYKALRSIINTPAARTPTPLMGVLHGDPDDWLFNLWRASLKPRRFLWSKLIIEDSAVQIYLQNLRL